MKEVNEYCTVNNYDTVKLDDDVNACIQQVWQPYGIMNVVQPIDGYPPRFYQVMVKYSLTPNTPTNE